MSYKKLFLVRSAKYTEGDDPGLSNSGRKQARLLGDTITSRLSQDYPQDIGIWTSTAKRAHETAQIIEDTIMRSNSVSRSIRLYAVEGLWNDEKHPKDIKWLKADIDRFQAHVLIIVSHLQCIRQFSVELGVNLNEMGYGEGAYITEGVCKLLQPQYK